MIPKSGYRRGSLGLNLPSGEERPGTPPVRVAGRARPTRRAPDPLSFVYEWFFLPTPAWAGRRMNVNRTVLATFVALSLPVAAHAVTTPAAGYIYTREILPELTEGCVAEAPGGVFVGVGPAQFSFPPPAGTRSILFVTDSGIVRTVATGLNSISDCVYDLASDTLYVTDSGAEFVGAVTGDTVLAIPGDSDAIPVAGLEVLPTGSIPYAFSIDLLGGNLLVSDAAGGGAGSVIEIDLSGMTPSASTFASDFDYTGGLVVDGSNVLISEALQPGFDSAIYSYSSAGAFQSIVSGPTYDHGSVDLAMDADGKVLVTGLPTLAVVDGGVATPLVTGLNGGQMFDAYGGGVAVDPFTGRIDFLASSFSGADDDKGMHRLIPVDKLEVGGGNTTTDCAMELYGVELVSTKPGQRARSAICVDGAACDADGVADGVCTFPLGVCFNVSDPRLADCTPVGVQSIELRGAKPEVDSAQALVDAAAALLPSADSTCVFSDGVRVPLRVSSGGSLRASKGFVRLRAVTDDVRPRKDNDIARLVCEPAL